MKSKLFLSLLPIKTKRLVIRTTIREDVELLIKMDKDAHVQKFLGGVKNIEYFERVKFIEKKVRKNEQGCIGMLTVVLESTGELIGFLNFNIDEIANNAELSYIFDSQFWNKGYCTEACEKIIKIGFDYLDLHRVYADTISGNLSSIRVLEKLGMKKEGKRREHVFVETVGEYRDFLDYGILKQEFK